MKMGALPVLLALLALFASCSSGAAPDSFPITISRPAAVSDSFRFQASGSVESSTSAPGIPPFSESHSWDFAALATVLAVDDNNLPASLSYKVEKLAETSPAPAELLPPGSDLFIIVRAGMPLPDFSKPLPPEAAQLAFMTLLPLGEPGVDYDALFGGPTPRKVSDTWPADAAALIAKAPKGSPAASLSPDSITGQAHLRGLVKVGDTDCLDLHLEVAFKGFGASSEWTLASDTTVEIALDLKLPLDPSLPPLETESTSTMTVSSAPPPGSSTRIEMKTTKSVSTTTTPLPPGED